MFTRTRSPEDPRIAQFQVGSLFSNVRPEILKNQEMKKQKKRGTGEKEKTNKGQRVDSSETAEGWRIWRNQSKQKRRRWHIYRPTSWLWQMTSSGTEETWDRLKWILGHESRTQQTEGHAHLPTPSTTHTSLTPLNPFHCTSGVFNGDETRLLRYTSLPLSPLTAPLL